LVAVTGASGRLGTAIVARLAAEGMRVRALDMVEGVQPVGTEYRFIDLTDESSVAPALDGIDVLVHLAGLHGAHLAAGVPRRDLWRVNVEGTWRLLRMARHVQRIVFASSMSVYGPGTGSGPARVLDEDTPVAPEDVYDMSKMLGERALDHLRADGREAVALRLGRFYYGSRSDYHLRKLSTGLDVHDAATAFAAVIRASGTLRPAYCVVSDLDLTYDQRLRLGTDLRRVLDGALPGFADKAESCGYRIPERYGKAAVTAVLRADTGWAPEHDLSWWSAVLDKEIAEPQARERPSGGQQHGAKPEIAKAAG